MEVDQKAVTTKPTAFTNMTEKGSPEVGSEGIVVNVHPDYLVPATYAHDPHYFPFLHQSQALGIEQLRPAFGRLNSLDAQWPTIKRVMPLYLNGQYRLFIKEAADLIGTPAPRRASEVATATSQFWEVLHYVFLLLMTPGFAAQLASVESFVRNLREDRSEALRNYRDYIVANHESHFAHLALDTATDFVDDLSLFRPLVATRICQAELASWGDLPQFTKSSFDRIRYFYGNAYERAGDLVLHFVALHNINQRGAFDRFSSWTLDGYLASDKAARLGPFADKRLFSEIIAPCYENALRNASHHGRMSYDPSSGQIACSPKRGRTGAKNRVTLTVWRYLEKCYDLTQALGILVSLHYGLDELLSNPA